MKGHQDVIALLNDTLTIQLTAINQYFIHAKMCENWGYHRLAKVARKASIVAMKQADCVIGRILYLEGVPNLQRLGKVSVGEVVKEQHELDLTLVKESVENLNKGIATCRTLGDNGSRIILESSLESDEEHLDWLEAQLEQIAQLGEALYLSEQVYGDD